MEIMIVNTAIDDERFSRKIENANPSFVPRVGDRVQVGYEPAPKVRNVIWDYDENKVTVQVH